MSAHEKPLRIAFSPLKRDQQFVGQVVRLSTEMLADGSILHFLTHIISGLNGFVEDLA